MKKLIICQTVVAVLILAAGLYAKSGVDYWPTWRGPNNMGLAPKANPPLTWSETENIKWKVELTGDGSNSSPIVWEDKIFFQIAVKTDKKAKTDASSESDDNSRHPGGPRVEAPSNVYSFDLVCIDRNSGKLLWQKTLDEAMPHQGHHQDHGYASFSPVTDGKYVWVSFGSRGLYCCDFNGKLIWSRDLIKMKTMWYEGGSPALAADTLIVVADHEGDSYIFAFEKNTGQLLWKQQRDETTSWATPIVADTNGQLHVITSAKKLIRCYDVKTGDVIWQCGGMTSNVIPSPVLGFGMVFCTSGFRGSALQAIKLGRKGDLTGSEAIAWQVNQATPYVPSPLLYKDKLYVCSVNDAVISCYNAKTGKAYFVKKRLEQIKGIYASPAAAADRIYFVGRNGVTYVIKPSEELEVLSVNKLNDRFDCSPAFVDNEIFLKGKQYLYCVASSK